MRPAAGFERPLPEASSGPGGDADERGARAMPSGNTHHASDEAPALKEQIASCHRRTSTRRALAASDVFAIPTSAKAPRPALLSASWKFRLLLVLARSSRSSYVSCGPARQL